MAVSTLDMILEMFPGNTWCRSMAAGEAWRCFMNLCIIGIWLITFDERLVTLFLVPEKGCLPSPFTFSSKSVTVTNRQSFRYIKRCTDFILSSKPFKKSLIYSSIHSFERWPCIQKLCVSIFKGHVCDFMAGAHKLKFTQPDNCCLRQTFHFFFPRNYNAPPTSLLDHQQSVTEQGESLDS